MEAKPPYHPSPATKGHETFHPHDPVSEFHRELTSDVLAAKLDIEQGRGRLSHRLQKVGKALVGKADSGPTGLGDRTDVLYQMTEGKLRDYRRGMDNLGQLAGYSPDRPYDSAADKVLLAFRDEADEENTLRDFHKRRGMMTSISLDTSREEVFAISEREWKLKLGRLYQLAEAQGDREGMKMALDGARGYSHVTTQGVLERTQKLLEAKLEAAEQKTHDVVRRDVAVPQAVHMVGKSKRVSRERAQRLDTRLRS